MRLVVTFIAAGMILLGSVAAYADDAPKQRRLRPVQRRSVQKRRPVQKAVQKHRQKSVQKHRQKSVQKPTQKPTQKGRRTATRRTDTRRIASLRSAGLRSDSRQIGSRLRRR